ncbi:MAG TPA: CHRD domain-containing protein [Stellaceae bacterium]|nr:CHRD domain-containing protein [Stellaceae bacterium]
MRNSKTIAGAGLALSLFCGAALADTLKFTVDLEPEQAGKPGKGTATFTVDTASKTLTGTIEYSGVATPQMAAFLSPPEKQGGNPGTLPIQLPANAASPISVKMQMPPAAIDGLKGGEWVLLLGTKQAPEIGGDVKPAQ